MTDAIRANFWEQRYRDGRIPWDRGAVSPALTNWLESGALRPCRILVPGCGHGYEVLELARRRFDVTALDYSRYVVRRLEQGRNKAKLSACVISADALVWQTEQAFDAIYEQTCLCALAPESWTVYAAQLRSWLRPAGRLFALFMQTGRSGGPPFHCELSAMRALFTEKHWQWPREPLAEVAHPMGFFEYAAVLTRKA